VFFYILLPFTVNKDSQYNNRNIAGTEKKTFQLICQGESTDDAETTVSGSAFQTLAAATGKDRLPIVYS